MARDSEALTGWKGNSSDWCQNLQSGETVEECIEEHTLSRSDVLKDVLWGFDPKNSILGGNIVAEDFITVWQGRHFSLDINRTMIADEDSKDGTRLSLCLAKGLSYLIIIHDEDYFEINYKPTFPVILKTFNPETDYNQVYNLALTEVSKSNKII